MGKLNRCRLWLQAHDDLFLDLVRIYIGAGLFVKAIYLMRHRDYLNDMIVQSGNSWFAPAAIGQYVILAHLVGGALLATGLFTRLAAFAQLPIVLGAVFYVYLPQIAAFEPRQYFEYSALVAFLLFWLGVFGSGRWSLDYMLSRKRAESPSVAPATAGTS